MHSRLPRQGNRSALLTTIMYQPRDYRLLHRAKDLVSFEVMVKETDLSISAQSILKKEAEEAIIRYRAPLEEYIKSHPEFLTSLVPLPVQMDMPIVCRLMAESASKAGVGPMASVAGVIAELVGKELLRFSPEVIVENGGDIFIKTDKPRVIGIYAGEDSPFKDRLAIQILPEDSPIGVCTSSGTIGHSLSFGKADAVTVLAQDTGLADACATAIGNLVKTPDDFPVAIEFAKRIAGLNGIILVKGDKFGAWGKVRLC